MKNISDQTKLALIISLVLFTFPTSSMAKECTDNNIKKAITHCQRSLNDIKGMLVLSKKEQKKAAITALVAVKPGYQCVKGAAETLKNASLFCSPPNPATALACAKTVLDIPGVYDNCEETVGILSKSYAHYKRAKNIIGLAGPSFFEQGGDEAKEFLSTCGYKKCKEKKQHADSYIESTIKEIDQQMEQITKAKGKLKSIMKELKKCEAGSSNCTNDSDFNSDFPQDDNNSVPDLILR